MSATDLTNLFKVKLWLGIPATDTSMDAVLQDIIDGVCADIRTYVSKNIFPTIDYSVSLDGNGKCVLFVPNYPIVSITSLTVNGNAIPARATVTGSGYVFSGPKIQLSGYEFCQGMQNVGLDYRAGYAISNEKQTIPAASTYTLTPLAPFGPWGQDLGVTYASTGAALNLVSGAPAQGEYQVSTDSSNVTTYTFNAADANTAVLLNYGYIPSTINRAATEWVGFRYANRKNQGIKSHSIAGDNTTFDTSSMPDSVSMMLEQFVRVFAIRS